MRFDQTTHDYTVAGIDAPPYSGKNALTEAAYLRLMTPKGSYFADPILGSELHKLKRSKDVPRLRRMAMTMAKQALEPLRLPYYLTDIVVSIDSALAGVLSIKALLTQADGSQTVTTINVQVAG